LAEHGTERRLAAILAADVVGYSRQMAADETGTLTRLRALRNEVIEPLVAEHRGRLFKTVGDAFLVEFASAVRALQCALAVQARMAEGDVRTQLRIGVHSGDVVAEGDDLLGDGVNIAVRLEGLAEPGGICISARVREDVAGKMTLDVMELGTPALKNIVRPVEVYVVRFDATGRSPAAEPASAHQSNLPQLVNALIGRERDVVEIETLLSQHRLVTLVGTGGVGKTSLALRVGADLMGRFPDGTRLVDLAPLDRAELVGEAVAAMFGLAVHGERPATDAIAAFLRFRRVLLILDNCEHLITAAAKLTDTLLKTCPGVCLLATSREALSVAGEHAYPVPLLDVPPQSTNLTAAAAMAHSAVHLFVERAASALGRFALTDETAPTVAEICRRLDGIPLAIELAAPRLKMLTPAALQARLDNQLHLLTTRSRTAMPRQQTLRAAIEWSYTLLSEAEQAMLRRFGVFAGSFSLEAVTAVGAGAPVEESDVFDVFAGLVDKSLVVSLAGAGENRYRLLESTRAFALEKLEVSHYAELARQLCEHMTIVFERADRTWPTTPRADWLAVYEPDVDNLRAALGWSLGPDGDPTLGVNLVSYTDWLWRGLSLLQEERRWFELALSHVDAATPPAVEARIRLGLGWYLYGGNRGRLSHNLRAIELMRQAGGEPVLLGRGLAQAGDSTRRYRDVAESEQYHDEALSVLRRCGRTKLLAATLLSAAVSRRYGGDLKVARARVEEALALSKKLGDVGMHVNCETELAIIEATAGQMAEAIERARRAVEASRRYGPLESEFLALDALAAFLISDGQIEPGRAAALRAFELSRALGNVAFEVSIELLALVLAVHGETDTAARLLGFADCYAEQHQLSRTNSASLIRSRLVERLHGAMSPEDCQTAMAAGAAWSEQEAIAAAEAA
jgi:predicted ATPase/class 3 adenylate cyclase